MNNYAGHWLSTIGPMELTQQGDYVEGTYDFHAVARYGEQCKASREAFWSLTVGLKDDPYHHVVKDQPRRPARGSRKPPTRKPAPRTKRAKKMSKTRSTQRSRAG